ncbi:MAG: M1 family aminopeptidase [bacterium]
MQKFILRLLTLTNLVFVGVSFSQNPAFRNDEANEILLKHFQRKHDRFFQQKFVKPAALISAQDKFDVHYYKLDIDVDPTTEVVKGFVEIKARAKVDQFSTVALDFRTNLVVEGVSQEAASYHHQNDVLQIQLSQVKQSGEEFAIRVDYRGQPAENSFGSFGFDYHRGAPIIWSLSEPYFARNWWPCKDVPNDKADSVDVILTVPEELIAVSNGSLISNTNNGDGTRTFHWHEGYPITTYLVSLAISNYATYSDWFHYGVNDSMEIQYYIYPEHFEGAKSQLNDMLEMMSLFHKIFGPYPFLREKYGIAQFPRGGGMEHQTITSQSGFWTELTVHELAHQWWGDKITNATWPDIWLNEGFASYSEALYFEHINGKPFYHKYMRSMDWDHPYAIFVDDTSSVWRIFDRTVYHKGAWLLHMLRHVVGDSTFFDILLAYSNDVRFAYGNATTRGFQDVCESVSGQNLDWFFQPWIYERGRPVYQAQWNKRVEGNSQVLNLQLKQIQYPNEALFPMPIDITVETARGDTIVTVFNDAAEQNFKITLNAEPQNIIIDKDGWILKRVDSISANEESPVVITDFVLKQNYPNPFNGETVIEFSLPRRETVELTLYNLSGQKIRTLISKQYEAGTYSIPWNGLNDEGQTVASGLYFYQIQAGNFKLQKKLLYIK